MLRRLYYLLPVNLRFFVRRVFYFPFDLFRKKSSLYPPKGMIFTGAGNFEKQGNDWIHLFTSNNWLKPESRVLDIGSGIGRIAIPLTGFLKGTYHGFDVVKTGVDWCTKHISPKFPSFHFLHINLFNDLYTSRGKQASDFHFPYPDNSFDFACAISIFTHLLPDEVQNYFREVHRVLNENGIFVSTFFLIDEESNALMKQHKKFNFRYSMGDYLLMDKTVKSANVAYRREFIYALIQITGFEIVKEFPGHWCGREKVQEIAFQDILVLKRK
jgi:SAM-dependent methyltransferase